MTIVYEEDSDRTMWYDDNIKRWRTADGQFVTKVTNNFFGNKGVEVNFKAQTAPLPPPVRPQAVFGKTFGKVVEKRFRAQTRVEFYPNCCGIGILTDFSGRYSNGEEGYKERVRELREAASKAADFRMGMLIASFNDEQAGHGGWEKVFKDTTGWTKVVGFSNPSHDNETYIHTYVYRCGDTEEFDLA